MGQYWTYILGMDQQCSTYWVPKKSANQGVIRPRVRFGVSISWGCDFSGPGSGIPTYGLRLRCEKPCVFALGETAKHTHNANHGAGIYTYSGVIDVVNVGKYSSTMEHMGYVEHQGFLRKMICCIRGGFSTWSQPLCYELG